MRKTNVGSVTFMIDNRITLSELGKDIMYKTRYKIIIMECEKRTNNKYMSGKWNAVEHRALNK